MRLALVLLVVATGASCAGLCRPLRCLDGQPVKVLQDPGCLRGVCGYTCAPDRWQVDA